MLTVVIKDSGEENVVKLTYENLWKELKDIPGAELIVRKNWLDSTTLANTKNKYICFVEADCLVNSGYFSSQIGLLKKNPYFRKLAMFSSSTAVTNWANKFYGYNVGNSYVDGIAPNKDKKSNQPYPVQISYLPGAIVRVNMIGALLLNMKPNTSWENDLVFLSTQVSLGFWRQGDGNRVYINPNATYLTTEEYVNDLGKFDANAGDLKKMFVRESI